MFCYQCEQTSKGTGCTAMGVCGKTPLASDLQDVLFHLTKGLSRWTHKARQHGIKDEATDLLTIEALFATVTNVDFDPERLGDMITRVSRARDDMRQRYQDACAQQGATPEELDGPASFVPAPDLAQLQAQAIGLAIAKRQLERGETLTGLEELIAYGLKGMAAYTDHAAILGRRSDAVMAFFHECLDFLCTEHGVEELLSMALRVGQVNLDVMGMLDEAHTTTFGHPSPTQVRVTARAGKAILVSGHDLADLKALLEQTAGSGIQIYTHGEMLPAHGYPELNKHDHLAGNYGGAWQDQAREFDDFPGAILMTTNCIQKPKDSYSERLFTCGLVAWPGVRHIRGHDFAPVIEAALAAPGFTEEGPEEHITVGFGHKAVLSQAEAVVRAVKEGKLRHFFLIGGCDGAKSGRNYYTELAQAVPDDCLIMTLACGKYRFNKLDFGEVAGLPRLLDIGQCNDAYSAIQIAAALAEAFETDVNGLPLSLVLSWYEQKAVVILLSLLHLGIKQIRLGPSLPAFLTPAALDVLIEAYQIAPISSVQEDLAQMLA